MTNFPELSKYHEIIFNYQSFFLSTDSNTEQVLTVNWEGVRLLISP